MKPWNRVNQTRGWVVPAHLNHSTQYHLISAAEPWDKNR